MYQLFASSLTVTLLFAAATGAVSASGMPGQWVHADVTANMPAADAAATQSSPLIWLIPIAMGVFALVLVFVIRRFSRPHRQPKAQEEIKKPGR